MSRGVCWQKAPLKLSEACQKTGHDWTSVEDVEAAWWQLEVLGQEIWPVEVSAKRCQDEHLEAIPGELLEPVRRKAENCPGSTRTPLGAASEGT